MIRIFISSLYFSLLEAVVHTKIKTLFSYYIKEGGNTRFLFFYELPLTKTHNYHLVLIRERDVWPRFLIRTVWSNSFENNF